MNGSLRAKSIAGVGIAAMLCGAMLTVMPSLAGAASVVPILNPGGETNPDCADLGYDIEAKFDAAGNPGDTGTASGDGLIVNWTFQDDDTIDFEVDEDSDYLVSAAIVKQANGANVYIYDPAVASDTELVDNEGDGQFSHITFCADGTENTTTTEEETTTTEEETTTTEEATTTTEETTTTTTEATTTTTEATTTTTEATTTTEGDVLGTSTVPEETSTTEGPEVEAESVTTAGPTVLDNTVTALPKTGSAADRLAPIGIALMILGAILVGGSRRSLLARN